MFVWHLFRFFRGFAVLQRTAEQFQDTCLTPPVTRN